MLWRLRISELYSTPGEYTSAKLPSIEAETWNNKIPKDIPQNIRNIEIRGISSHQFFINTLYSENKTCDSSLPLLHLKETNGPDSSRIISFYADTWDGKQ